MAVTLCDGRSRKTVDALVMSLAGAVETGVEAERPVGDASRRHPPPPRRTRGPPGGTGTGATPVTCSDPSALQGPQGGVLAAAQEALSAITPLSILTKGALILRVTPRSTCTEVRRYTTAPSVVCPQSHAMASCPSTRGDTQALPSDPPTALQHLTLSLGLGAVSLCALGAGRSPLIPCCQAALPEN